MDNSPCYESIFDTPDSYKGLEVPFRAKFGDTEYLGWKILMALSHPRFMKIYRCLIIDAINSRTPQELALVNARICMVYTKLGQGKKDYETQMKSYVDFMDKNFSYNVIDEYNSYLQKHDHKVDVLTKTMHFDWD